MLNVQNKLDICITYLPLVAPIIQNNGESTFNLAINHHMYLCLIFSPRVSHYFNSYDLSCIHYLLTFHY